MGGTGVAEVVAVDIVSADGKEAFSTGKKTHTQKGECRAGEVVHGSDAYNACLPRSSSFFYLSILQKKKKSPTAKLSINRDRRQPARYRAYTRLLPVGSGENYYNDFLFLETETMFTEYWAELYNHILRGFRIYVPMARQAAQIKPHGNTAVLVVRPCKPRSLINSNQTPISNSY